MATLRRLALAAALCAAPAALDAQARSDSSSSVAPADSAAAARRDTSRADYRSPRTATVISVFLIGGGQFYSGEPARGLLLWGSGTTGGVLALAALDHCWNVAGDCTRDNRVLIAGAGIMWAAYLTSLIDAHNAAHRHNRREGLEPPARRVGAVVAPGASGTTRLGVAIALGR